MDADNQDAPGNAEGSLLQDESPQLEDGIHNAFRHISAAQLDQYRLAMPSNDDAAVGIVTSALGLDNSQKDTRQHLQWSISARILNFAIERKFSNTKTGVLFNISQTLLKSIQQGDSRDSCELLLHNCLVPLAKAHPEPDAPQFSAIDIKAVAEFLVDHVIQFFNLFRFVLREDRAQQNTHVQNIIEIPYSLPLDQAFPEDLWKSQLQQEAADEEQAKADGAAQALADAQAAEQVRAEQERADELFKKKQELAKKPERLEEAVEKLIKWRIENEKQKLREQYTQEVNALKGELQSLSAQDSKGGKFGKGK